MPFRGFIILLLALLPLAGVAEPSLPDHLRLPPGFTAELLETEAVVEVTPSEAGFSITAITLKLKAQVPGVSAEQFQELAAGAKANCPISKALAAVPITLDATLA